MTLPFTGQFSLLQEAELTGEGQSHLAFVSGVEYDSGTVFVDQDMDDPTQPLIVWHIENEGGEPSQGG